MTRRVVTVGLVVLGVWVGLGAFASAGAFDAAPSGVPGAAPPCPHGRPLGPHEACTGPVVHHSGAASAVTIIVSVVVGIGVALGALVLVRRRITEDAARPRPAPRPRRPS